MGEYAEFRINGVDLYMLKDYSAANPILMEVFSPKDHFKYDIDEQEYREEKHVYRTTARFAIERLDILGFNLERARKAVSEAVEAYDANPIYENLPLRDLDPIRHWDEGENPPDGLSDIVDSIADWHELEKAYLQFFGNRKNTDSMRYCKTGEKPQLIEPVNAFAALMFSLKGSPESMLGIDIHLELRIILDSMQEDCLIEYDYSNVVAGGWCGDDETFLLEKLENEVFSVQNKIIILTEGTSDDEFLKDALELLHPEVSHLFKFFDYHQDASPQRGADSLCKLGNALVAAGLPERFILLFDNDTAGFEAKSKLPHNLPSNIAASMLPDLDFAGQYPTIGPSGNVIMDINGSACAIETYLGKSLITDSNGNYIPIIWDEYHKKLKRYQGSYESDEKQKIQKDFRSIVAQAKSDGIDSVKHDCSDLELVLSKVFEISSHLIPGGAL